MKQQDVVCRALVVLAALLSCGASHRTENFLVTAASSSQARAVGEAAEYYRRQLALEWLGQELEAWSEPCPIQVTVNERLGARGETSYVFRRGRPSGWQMQVQGPWETVRHSVLPHEITHAILATYFGQPLPRWAEEGASVIVEHQLDRLKLEQMMAAHLTSGRTISIEEMFRLQEYPGDVLVLYTQGYSLVRFFVSHGGKQKFIEFLGDGVKNEDWHDAALRHYGYHSLDALQVAWLDWELGSGGQ